MAPRLGARNQTRSSPLCRRNLRSMCPDRLKPIVSRSGTQRMNRWSLSASAVYPNRQPSRTESCIRWELHQELTGALIRLRGDRALGSAWRYASLGPVLARVPRGFALKEARQPRCLAHPAWCHVLRRNAHHSSAGCTLGSLETRARACAIARTLASRASVSAKIRMDSGRFQTKLASIRPKFARIRPHLGPVWPNLTNLSVSWADFEQIWAWE